VVLPASLTTPVAAILAIGGFLSCFFGHRLFRLVLGLYGFILGASQATSMMAASSTWTLVVAALAGGVVGAILMIAAYFLGVGLLGAGLAALALNAVWHFIGGEPPTVVLVIVCVLGALLALSVARYVIVFGTALAGSWTLIIGVLALLGHKGAAHAASAGDVWILYPLTPQPDRWWMVLLWLVIALAGAVVQLSTTKTSGAKRTGVKRQKAKD